MQAQQPPNEAANLSTRCQQSKPTKDLGLELSKQEDPSSLAGTCKGKPHVTSTGQKKLHSIISDSVKRERRQAGETGHVKSTEKFVDLVDSGRLGLRNLALCCCASITTQCWRKEVALLSAHTHTLSFHSPRWSIGAEWLAVKDS